jgi:hypothetical protein
VLHLKRCTARFAALAPGRHRGLYRNAVQHCVAQGWPRQRPTLGNAPTWMPYAESVTQTRHERRCVTPSA